MSVSGEHLEMSGLDERFKCVPWASTRVVTKTPCTVTGGGEDARQELAPKLRHR